MTNATCGPGSVAVGFRARLGKYFNQLWLECVSLRPDGSFAGGVQVTAPAGQSGGSVQNAARCPNGLVLRGINGRAGASIDVISGICSNVSDIRNRPQARGALTPPISRPGAGGQPAEAACPAGSALVGFQTRSGEYIDHLWIQCSDLRGYGGGPGQPGNAMPGSTWKGDPVAACISAVRARIQQDYGNRVNVNLPPNAAKVTPVSTGQLFVPVTGTGQFTVPGQRSSSTRYDCQIDKRFGSVNSVNYTRPDMQPQPR